MLHFEAIPPLLWPFLGLLVVLVAAVSYRNRRLARREQTQRTRERHRSIARYKAWQWLVGTPKPRRLTDQRKSK